MKAVLKWRNKFSGEEGFVKSVSKVNGHFINTWDLRNAKIYKGEKQLNNDLEILNCIGETKMNMFFRVDL